MELQRRSSGVAKGGLTTGIIGTALGGLNSLALMGAGVNAATRNNDTVCVPNGVMFNNGFGTFPWGGGFGYGMYPFGMPTMVPQTVVVNSNDEGNRDRNCNGRNGEGVCSEDHFVNRYELSLQQQIAEKDSQIALRDANTYNDQKSLELYKYIDGQLTNIRSELARQAVINQKTEDSFRLAEQDLHCCCDKLQIQIDRERDERRCDDNTIITYANSTFYPQRVADVAVGATTTPENTYNPLSCRNNCGCGTTR